MWQNLQTVSFLLSRLKWHHKRLFCVFLYYRPVPVNVCSVSFTQVCAVLMISELTVCSDEHVSLSRPHRAHRHPFPDLSCGPNGWCMLSWKPKCTPASWTWQHRWTYKCSLRRQIISCEDATRSDISMTTSKISPHWRLTSVKSPRVMQTVLCVVYFH